MSKPEIRTVNVVRYIQPLREGGSLPGLVEADDDFKYVIKFRGAGQGKKALVAELIGGELARAIGLQVPELVFMQLDGTLSRLEADEEIQDLLKFSDGLNLGLHYLSGAITYDPLVSIADELSASKVVLLDSMISNVDRTHRNTNMLNWKKELWLIDHGASLYFHHAWKSWEDHAKRTFPKVKEHVMLDRASKLEEAASAIKTIITPEVIEQIVSVVPDDFLIQEGDDTTPEEKRKVYATVLQTKLSNLDLLTKEAIDARKGII
ncbi:HipA family kinase [Algivirga pacifica]|uniref:HipA-like kinase domain-containing protein n=1 Tax=Algivirga pacifica TaxID=1162670 RepID=A0ABP9D6T9_9BACT